MPSPPHKHRERQKVEWKPTDNGWALAKLAHIQTGATTLRMKVQHMNLSLSLNKFENGEKNHDNSNRTRIKIRTLCTCLSLHKQKKKIDNRENNHNNINRTSKRFKLYAPKSLLERKERHPIQSNASSQSQKLKNTTPQFIKSTKTKEQKKKKKNPPWESNLFTVSFGSMSHSLSIA